MEAGKMRHTIKFKAISGTKNRFGELVQTWNEVCTVRAAIEPLLGREYFAAEATQSQVELKIRTRYRAGLNNAMRIEHNGVDYEILSLVNVDFQNKELLAYCKKVT